MPLLISLKEPPINMIVEGDIKDDAESVAKWDETFSNGCLMVKNRTGQNIVIPLWKESNVTFIQEVTEEQLEEQRKQMEEANQQGGRDSKIVKPEYVFPTTRRRPPGGGGVTL